MGDEFRLTMEVARRPRNAPEWLRQAGKDFAVTTLGWPNFTKLTLHMKPLIDIYGWTKVRPAWQRYLRATEPRFLSAARFAETFGAYASQAPSNRYQSADEADRRAGIPVP